MTPQHAAQHTDDRITFNQWSALSDCFYVPTELINGVVLPKFTDSWDDREGMNASRIHAFTTTWIATQLSNELAKFDPYRDKYWCAGQTGAVESQTYGGFLPDVFVVDSNLADLNTDLSGALTPAIVIEVLSPKTRKRDETVKLAGYRQVPQIEQYFLVDTGARSITRYNYRKAGDKVVQNLVEDPILLIQLPDIPLMAIDFSHWLVIVDRTPRVR